MSKKFWTHYSNSFIVIIRSVGSKTNNFLWFFDKFLPIIKNVLNSASFSYYNRFRYSLFERLFEIVWKLYDLRQDTISSSVYIYIYF